MEARNADQSGNGSTGRLNFTDVANDPLLSGWEIHGFHTYSKLTYPELVARQSERILSPEEIYAVLKNSDLYLGHQSFYQTPDKWLLTRDEFLVSPWKTCTKNFTKLQVKGHFCVHEYSDTSGKRFRYTLVSGDVEVENSVYLVQSLPSKRKKPEPLEEVDGFLCELFNIGIDCLNRAKKTKSVTEACALRDEAIQIVLALERNAEPIQVVRDGEGGAESVQVVRDDEPVEVVMGDQGSGEPIEVVIAEEGSNGGS